MIFHNASKFGRLRRHREDFDISSVQFCTQVEISSVSPEESFALALLRVLVSWR